MSTNVLEVSIGVETVLRLERDAWSMVKWLRRATDEYAPSLPLPARPRQYVAVSYVFCHSFG